MGCWRWGDTARALAHTWSSAGLDALRQYSEPDANDVSPGRQTFEAALLRNFRAMGDQQREHAAPALRLPDG